MESNPGKVVWYAPQEISYKDPISRKTFKTDTVFIDGVVLDCNPRIHKDGSTSPGMFWIISVVSFARI